MWSTWGIMMEFVQLPFPWAQPVLSLSPPPPPPLLSLSLSLSLFLSLSFSLPPSLSPSLSLSLSLSPSAPLSLSMPKAQRMLASLSMVETSVTSGHVTKRLWQRKYTIEWGGHGTQWLANFDRVWGKFSCLGEQMSVTTKKRTSWRIHRDLSRFSAIKKGQLPGWIYTLVGNLSRKEAARRSEDSIFGFCDVDLCKDSRPRFHRPWRTSR